MKYRTVFLILTISFLSYFLIDSSSAQSSNPQECKGIYIPTITEDHKSLSQNPQSGCTEVVLNIESSSTTIQPGGFITLKVNSNGLGIPPYTWQAGNGYVFENDGKTHSDSDEITMESSSGTCGVSYDVYTVVKVRDFCGNEGTIGIRNSAGKWIYKEGTGASTNCYNDWRCDNTTCPQYPQAYSCYVDNHGPQTVCTTVGNRLWTSGSLARVAKAGSSYNCDNSWWNNPGNNTPLDGLTPIEWAQYIGVWDSCTCTIYNSKGFEWHCVTGNYGYFEWECP